MKKACQEENRRVCRPAERSVSSETQIRLQSCVPASPMTVAVSFSGRAGNVLWGPRTKRKTLLRTSEIQKLRRKKKGLGIENELRYLIISSQQAEAVTRLWAVA